MFSFNLSDPSIGGSVDRFAQETVANFQKTSGFDQLRVYVNYAHGTESLAARYGSHKLPELRRLKEQWDPTGLFRFNNPLLN